MSRYPFIAVYIMANRRNGTLYTGVSANLPRRAAIHRAGKADGFATQYDCKRLVWFEKHDMLAPAFRRESAIKRYHRAWKIALIEARNPDWQDLARHLDYNG